VLCSAVLVGMMIASGVRRAYRTPVTAAGRPATGAFETGRSTDEPVAAQHERAQESGRGRHAQAPWQIPWQGWKDILWRTYEQIGEDRLLAVAAGVVFYGLLAVFPAVTALVSLYGLFASPSTISDELSFLAGIFPQGAVDILREQIGRLTAGSGAKLGFGFIFGLAVALWSANAGMKAIMDALNVVYEEKEKRGFIKLNLVSLAFTIAAIVSVLLALGAVVVLPVALSYLGLQSDRAAVSPCTPAAPAADSSFRSCRTVPVRSKPLRAALAVDQRRQRLRSGRLAHKLGITIVVSR
jgi:membrane protein